MLDISRKLSDASFVLAIALSLAQTWVTESRAAPAPAEAVSRRSGPIVKTSEGLIQGFVSHRVVKFLGIPYATAPVGLLRWRPPMSHRLWHHVRDAIRFAPICAQTTTLGVFSGPRNDNEDCLYLNVFTPNVSTSAHLPVIVYIHGGGNFAGETPGYDGSKLAFQGKVVVVTVAYRLNLMGFLAHPALDKEDHLHGNYGILDQQAALKWVRRNIGNFGGDGSNVTIGGQSSGATDTMINMVSPLAGGLFQRAICQSACLSPYPLAGNAEAEAAGVAFAEAAGCGASSGSDVARCLRELPVARIEELAGTATAPSKFVIGSGIVDGQIVPDQPLALLKSGRFNHVPLMNGITRDEVNFLLAVAEYWNTETKALGVPSAEEQYRSYVRGSFIPPKYITGTDARVLDLYPASDAITARAAWNRAGSDVRACEVRALAKILSPQIPVFMYEFADRTAPSYFPDTPHFEPGAYHTADIQYLFPFWHGGPQGIRRFLNENQQKLSNQIIAAWANFARSGNPSGPGSGSWPRYTTEAKAQAWMVEDLPNLTTISDDAFSSYHRCQFWDAMHAAP